MNRRLIIGISAISIVSSLTLGIVTSCDNKQTGDEAYNIKVNDAINIDELAEKNDIVIDDNTIYTSSETSIADIVGSKIFAIKEGETNIEFFMDGQRTPYAVLPLEVVGYETYEDISPLSKGCSIGGVLIDIDTGIDCQKGSDYTFTFSISDSLSQNFQVVLSDEDVVSYEKTNEGHVLHANNVGNSKIEIINSENGVTLYRNVVKVVHGYHSAEEYTFALTKYDYWLGAGGFDGVSGSTNFTFLRNGSGVMAGSDVGQAFEDITFNFVFDDTFKDKDLVKFDLTNVVSSTDFNIDYILLFKSGSVFNLYNSSGFIYEFYFPMMNS